MNKKKQLTVETTLQAQFDALCALLPVKLQRTFKETCYFAGGCIYSLWNGQEPKDYDVFCTSKAFLRSLSNLFKAAELTAAPMRASTMTDYTITLVAGEVTYQFVTAFVGEPEKVVGEFDFMHNMFWFHDGALHCHALGDWKYLDSNKLVFNKARGRDAASTITRVPKFVARGMEISRDEMALIMNKATAFPAVISERRSIKKLLRGRRY